MDGWPITGRTSQALNIWSFRATDMAGQIKAASKVIVALFEELQRQEISESTLSKALDVHLNTVANWRKGKVTPSIIDMGVMAGFLGFELKLEPVA